ncbi:dienelactone hydrolase [Roseibium sp. RKSG952]|nr:dienelactone hydrolase [Roseibium sp. RKSG952]
MTSGNRIDQIRPDAPDLAHRGPHPVGRLTLSLTNPDQIDILNTGETAPLPRYDRPLTVEVFYPAAAKTAPDPIKTYLRDGKTPVTLLGTSTLDAAPQSESAPYPLVLISHGYPGNRFLMSHLAESLASRGYVAASIDHTDSTYRDKAAFGSTLVNRPLDQLFVLDEMQRLTDMPGGPLSGLIDTSKTGLVGYSMGGYGALIAGGAGVTEKSVGYEWGAPNRTLARHTAGSKTHESLIDPRLAAIIAIGPWGRERDFWDAKGMAGLRIPTLFVAGSEDDISGYENGVRKLWQEATGTDRHLLTFLSANHNAAAPLPAPAEAFAFSETLGWYPYEHYADAVWDTVRMNNILQHFAAAFLDLHVKGDTQKAAYLNLVPEAEMGVHALDDGGLPTPDHSYWTGFADRTAKGLLFETLPAGAPAQ